MATPISNALSSVDAEVYVGAGYTYQLDHVFQGTSSFNVTTDLNVADVTPLGAAVDRYRPVTLGYTANLDMFFEEEAQEDITNLREYFHYSSNTNDLAKFCIWAPNRLRVGADAHAFGFVGSSLDTSFSAKDITKASVSMDSSGYTASGTISSWTGANAGNLPSNAHVFGGDSSTGTLLDVQTRTTGPQHYLGETNTFSGVDADAALIVFVHLFDLDGLPTLPSGTDPYAMDLSVISTNPDGFSITSNSTSLGYAPIRIDFTRDSGEVRAMFVLPKIYTIPGLHPGNPPISYEITGVAVRVRAPRTTASTLNGNVRFSMAYLSIT